MTVKERILAIRLLEKQDRCPGYAEGIGVRVQMTDKDSKEMEEKHV